MTDRLVERHLSTAQKSCGDVLDRLPCLHCGAETLRECVLPLPQRKAAGDLINNTPGLHNRLLALRALAASAGREVG